MFYLIAEPSDTKLRLGCLYDWKEICGAICETCPLFFTNDKDKKAK